jgi:hypothetical protein
VLSINFATESMMMMMICTQLKLKLIWVHHCDRSCGSSGSIVSDYGLDDRGSIPDKGRGLFFSSPCVQTGSEAHPASYPMSTGGPFSGGKARPGRDADHSPPSSAEVKYEYELYLLSPQAPSWRVAGQLYFTLLWYTRTSLLLYLYAWRQPVHAFQYQWSSTRS